ncbi:hypothetical protein ANTPLA_LOCUS5611 [Anthophora plagiata]
MLDDGIEDETVASRTTEAQKCRFCKLQKRHEVLDSMNSRTAGSTAKKRKDASKNARIHRVKRHRTSRDQTLSACIEKCSKGEEMKNMKKYIQKAIDFGVESGYLIPKDTGYKLLRVSSDLMNERNYTSRDRKSVSKVSHVRDRSPRRTPIRFEDYERQQRHSNFDEKIIVYCSRVIGYYSCGLIYYRSAHEQVIDNENDENDNEYDYDKEGEKKNNADNTNRTKGDEQLNQSDGEKTEDKREDDASDVSMDEDESEEDEDEKKRDETSKT